MSDHGLLNYASQQLGQAASTLRGALPQRERVLSAFVDNLMWLKPENFPREDLRTEFEALMREAHKADEHIYADPDGPNSSQRRGTIDQSLSRLSDPQIDALASRILRLAEQVEVAMTEQSASDD